MAKNPSTVWYFKDWSSDRAVSSCSRPARSFWLDLLAIMAEHGGFLLNEVGKPYTMAALARNLGDSPRAVARWMRELEDNGVFSRDENGVPYNRRMVREAAARAQKTMQKRDAKHVQKCIDLDHAKPLASLETAPKNTDDSLTSGSYATSSEPSTPIYDPKLSSLTPRARESGESEDLHTEKDGPEEARSARLAVLPPPKPPPRPIRACGQSRRERPPPDLVAIAARRQQQIVNFAEWLKTHALGSFEKQVEAREMLGRARLSLSDWNGRCPADKALYEELVRLYRADPLRRRRDQIEAPAARQWRIDPIHQLPPAPHAPWRKLPPPPTTDDLLRNLARRERAS
jgi:hypothetical protein